jgi:hypothetical protein
MSSAFGNGHPLLSNVLRWKVAAHEGITANEFWGEREKGGWDSRYTDRQTV